VESHKQVMTNLVLKPAFIILIYITAFTLFSCNSTSNKVQPDQIDSLIEIQKINENCILVKFGADAVSAINTQNGIVVIDAGISSKLTARYKKIIENEFAGNGFAYLIYTHAHPDHFGGSSIFTGCRVVGHSNCSGAINTYQNLESRTEKLNKIYQDYNLQLQSSNPGTEDWKETFTQMIRYKGAYRDAENSIPYLKPSTTFVDSLVIDMGSTTFDLTYFGKLHSDSDILVFVPEMSVLFIGDLFNTYGRPSYDANLIADTLRWQHTVEWIEKRMDGINIIVGGHGQIMSMEALKDFTEAVTSKSF